jgi:hypothetical protein
MTIALITYGLCEAYVSFASRARLAKCTATPFT